MGVRGWPAGREYLKEDVVSELSNIEASHPSLCGEIDCQPHAFRFVSRFSVALLGSARRFFIDRPLQRLASGYNLSQVISGLQVPFMNFNLYLDDQTAKELDRTAKKLGETRSGLIRKALREWLDKKALGSPGWPSLILEWQGVPDTPPFESYRGELLPPREDTFS